MAPLQRIVFSKKPLSGFIQVGGHFSIFPAHQWVELNANQSWPYPSKATFYKRKVDVFGPPYPLVFEIDQVEPSDGDWYEQATLKLERYERLACLFIIGLESAAHQTSPDRWARFETSNAAGIEVSYGRVSLGFSVNGDMSLERFINEGGTAALPYLPDGSVDYYDALHVGDALDYPNQIVQLMDNYTALSPQHQRDFDRAAFLFLQGEFLRSGNFAPYTSYSSAIECVLDKNSEKCATCGQEKYGINKRFRDFLEKYAPASQVVERLQRNMYSHRSKETHGLKISRVDKNTMFDSFEVYDFLFPWKVRKSLANWILWSQ